MDISAGLSLTSLPFQRRWAQDSHHSLLDILHPSDVFYPITLAKDNPKSTLLFTFSAFTPQMLKKKKKSDNCGLVPL